MVVLALLAVPIAFLNELNHLAVLQILSGPDYLRALTADQLHAQAMLFLNRQPSQQMESDGFALCASRSAAAA